MLYRIVTEDKNRAGILKLLGSFFDGFTMYKAQGYYANTREPALIIEIDDMNLDNSAALSAKVRSIVKALKKMNQQDCVLLQKISAISEML